MDPARLDRLLDTLIAGQLRQRQQQRLGGASLMRVVISGEDVASLPATLDCLAALAANGYALALAFSHSATCASLQSACLDGMAQRGIEAWCDSRDPAPTGEEYAGLYLPALSVNSLSKIALGLCDNLVCRWVFHALAGHKPVTVTLSAACREGTANALPPALRERLAHYATALSAYGCTLIGQRDMAPPPALDQAREQGLIALSDVRQHRGQTLYVGRHTLITPAAHDEIRARGIAIVQTR